MNATTSSDESVRTHAGKPSCSVNSIGCNKASSWLVALGNSFLQTLVNSSLKAGWFEFKTNNAIVCKVADLRFLRRPCSSFPEALPVRELRVALVFGC